MSTEKIARDLLEGRVASVTELEKADSEVAAAREQLATAIKRHRAAWQAARTAGWTDKELTKSLGLTRPANRQGGRPKESRIRTESLQPARRHNEAPTRQNDPDQSGAPTA